jgi:hypothetical protein
MLLRSRQVSAVNHIYEFVSDYGLITTGSDYSDQICIGGASHLLVNKVVKVSRNKDKWVTSDDATRDIWGNCTSSDTGLRKVPLVRWFNMYDHKEGRKERNGKLRDLFSCEE